MKSSWVLITSTKSHCGTCNGYMDILSKENLSTRSPLFFICWTCKTVCEAGKGEVERES